ncbi:MAG: hypothetical protein SFY96_06165 [Planctomycetota bacterium]|nr:hypothetical protein [Planctomycetota bacterium]
MNPLISSHPRRWNHSSSPATTAAAFAALAVAAASIASADLTLLYTKAYGHYGASAKCEDSEPPASDSQNDSFEITLAANVSRGPSILSASVGTARSNCSFNYRTVWTPAEIRGSDSMAIDAQTGVLFQDPHTYIADAGASAESGFTYNFTPTHNECWTLTFSIAGTGGIRVYADDGDDSILGAGTGPNETYVSGTVSYLFRAGQQYGFHIAASAGGNTLGPALPRVADASAWSFVFTKGGNCCIADYNQDSFLDFGDFDDFVADFEAGRAGSDINGDGFLDFSDFDDFVVAFEAGC